MPFCTAFSNAITTETMRRAEIGVHIIKLKISIILVLPKDLVALQHLGICSTVKTMTWHILFNWENLKNLTHFLHGAVYLLEWFHTAAIVMLNPLGHALLPTSFSVHLTMD